MRFTALTEAKSFFFFYWISSFLKYISIKYRRDSCLDDVIKVKRGFTVRRGK